MAESHYYAWSKEFLEAGKRCLAGDTARATTSDKAKALRQEASALKEVIAEQALELRLHKKTSSRVRLSLLPASEVRAENSKSLSGNILIFDRAF
jgi:hypothetical protein